METQRTGGLQPLDIPVDEIHIWQAAPSEAAAKEEYLSSLLSTDEWARAQRFHFEKDKQRYIAVHGMLRQILGACSGQAPQQIRLEYNAYGKPYLISEAGSPLLAFSLSYSGEVALYAVTYRKSVGIDVEHIRTHLDTALIAARFFSAPEIEALQSTAAHHRRELFFQIWCRKEAVLKAMGTGLSFPTEQLDVLPSWVMVPGYSEADPGWNVQDLSVEGYAAAVAVSGGPCRCVFRGCWQVV